MSPRTGRPKSDNPKSYKVGARLDQDTYDKLRVYCEETGKSNADVVREGIRKVLETK